jgi:flagellar biosynthesis protein FliQ
MGLTETSVALAGCVLVLVVAIILDRRPYRPGKLNYIPLMIIALAAILVLGRHLLAFFLCGVSSCETIRPGKQKERRP